MFSRSQIPNSESHGLVLELHFRLSWSDFDSHLVIVLVQGKKVSFFGADAPSDTTDKACIQHPGLSLTLPLPVYHCKSWRKWQPNLPVTTTESSLSFLRWHAHSPGNAIKASDCLAISAFLWCISATAFSSPTVSPDICNHHTRKNKHHILLAGTGFFAWPKGTNFLEIEKEMEDDLTVLHYQFF